MCFNRPLVWLISWCALCVSCLSRPPDVKNLGASWKSQSSILSSRHAGRKRERERSRESRWLMQRRMPSFVGRTEPLVAFWEWWDMYVCVPKIFFSGAAGDFHSFIPEKDTQSHSAHTQTHPEVQGRTKWWVTPCLIVLLLLPTAVSSKSLFWQSFLCLPDTHIIQTHTHTLVWGVIYLYS